MGLVAVGEGSGSVGSAGTALVRALREGFDTDVRRGERVHRNERLLGTVWIQIRVWKRGGIDLDEAVVLETREQIESEARRVCPESTRNVLCLSRSRCVATEVRERLPAFCSRCQ
mgnify:CR=1 FL=1